MSEAVFSVMSKYALRCADGTVSTPLDTAKAVYELAATDAHSGECSPHQLLTFALPPVSAVGASRD